MGVGNREGCVCLYPQGERWQKGESETERCKETETVTGKAESGTKRGQRAGGRAAAAGLPGPSANCFAQSSGPHTAVLWGVWHCPQNLKGPRRPCVRGVSNPSLSRCPQWQGPDGQGPRFSVAGAELTLGDHDGETGAGARGARPAPLPVPSCRGSLNLWPPAPTCSPQQPPVCSVPPSPLHQSPPFRSRLGLGSGRGAQRLSWGGGLVDY